MTLPLGTGVEWKPAMMELLEKELPRFDAVVIGPGLGRTGKTVDFIRAFVAKCPAQVVFDADALFALAQNAGLISELPPPAVLTPHPGEMARLLNTTNAAIQNDRLEAVNSFVANTLPLWFSKEPEHWWQTVKQPVSVRSPSPTCQSAVLEMFFPASSHHCWLGK